MEAAKAAVSKIAGRKGHTTEVDEVVNPAVTTETVKPQRHEETTQAVDREVHQDHYHTTVQPIAHQEVLPEKHSHNMMPTQHKEFQHGNHGETKQRVAAELGQFQDKSVTHQTQHSTAAAPTVTGEHVHHHVHETVQPVINKETIAPEVVHTTIPVHETHHAGSEHHGMSALPMKTLGEFQKAGGVLSGGKSHTHEEYSGAPRAYNEKLTTTAEKVLGGVTGHHTGPTGSTGQHTGSGLPGTTGTGHHTGSGLPGTTGTGHHTGSSGYPGSNTTSGVGSSGYGTRDSGVDVGGSRTANKPSMADKMNPRVDADRDGRAGVMD